MQADTQRVEPALRPAPPGCTTVVLPDGTELDRDVVTSFIQQHGELVLPPKARQTVVDMILRAFEYDPNNAEETMPRAPNKRRILRESQDGAGVPTTNLDLNALFDASPELLGQIYMIVRNKREELDRPADPA